MGRKKKYHFIYKTTNLKNKKFYIGMHSTTDLNDGYIGSGTKLKKSIEVYGIKCFKFEILEFLPDRDSLKKRERELVNEDTLNDKMCMNLKLGGDSGFVNEEHKNKFITAGKEALIKKSKLSMIWITNGKENKKVKKSIIIPEGWKKGKIIKFSK
jgi:hypothetical protein